jgi:KDO2-lipid IV(A) lauroyltransferase
MPRGWRLVRVLPQRVVWTAFAAGADRAARRRGRGARQLAENLRRVVGADLGEPELDELVRAGLRSYARYWMEAFRLPNRTREQILEDFQVYGDELLEAAVADGRGAVVAVPHAGNWDLAGAWGAARGWPIATVVERLRPESLYRRFLAYRSTLGMDIVPLTGGGTPAIDVLAGRLAAGYIVPLVADRDLSARGIEVTFFGERTRMPPGPALLAIRTGAPLFVASLWYDGDRARAEVTGPVPVPGADTGSVTERVRVVTQRIAERFEVGIAAHPTDWHMLQRVWPRSKAVAATEPGTGV